jgi:hypothetical protein
MVHNFGVDLKKTSDHAGLANALALEPVHHP